jgi:hypothetical protein
VDPRSVAEKLEPRTMLRRCVEKTREPGKRCGKATAICEDDDQLVISERHFLDPGIDARH